MLHCPVFGQLRAIFNHQSIWSFNKQVYLPVTLLVLWVRVDDEFRGSSKDPERAAVNEKWRPANGLSWS